jgi:hypothetical protein
MVKALFHREFNWRRPNSPIGFCVKPLDQPQTLPRDVIEAAVAKGAATIVAPRRTFPGPSPDPSGDEPHHRRN